jgi:hypothetical protein
MTRPLLDFDDFDADDDEPAKGVTVGDIRAWHDDNARLRALLGDLYKRICRALEDKP